MSIESYTPEQPWFRQLEPNHPYPNTERLLEFLGRTAMVLAAMSKAVRNPEPNTVEYLKTNSKDIANHAFFVHILHGVNAFEEISQAGIDIPPLLERKVHTFAREMCNLSSIDYSALRVHADAALTKCTRRATQLRDAIQDRARCISRKVTPAGPAAPKRNRKPLAPLSKSEKAVFDLLKGPDHPMTAGQVANALARNGRGSLSIDAKEVSRLCKRSAMKQRHVKNRPNVGYYIAH